MKRLLFALPAIILLYAAPGSSAQPRRLLASSVHYANGSFDSARYFYSGNRGGWHRDAGSDILPRQVVERDGSIPVMYDSALVWNGSSLQLTARYTNTFNAADKVVATTIRRFGNQPANQGEEYTYNSAGNYTLVGYIDSADTWPSMAPAYFKRSTYNAGNQPLADTFYYTGFPPGGGFTYRYNSAGQKEEVLQFYYMPAYTVVDSARFTWYPNGLLRTEQHTMFDSGTAFAGILDTFGYKGNNPHYTYRRNDQFYTGSNGWETLWLAINTLHPGSGGYYTMNNYYSSGGGSLPSVPSQVLVASYNADSTLDQVAYYNNGSTQPGIVYRYYYRLQPAAGVGAPSAAKRAIRVFPVPAAPSGAVSVAIDGLVTTGSYTITNAAGQLVLSGAVQQGTVLVFHNLPPGNYTIRCENLCGKIIVL